MTSIDDWNGWARSGENPKRVSGEARPESVHNLGNSLAILETVIECALGVALLLGLYPRVVAWCSAALLMSFALTMSIALGIVAPLSYSVSAAAGATLLAASYQKIRAGTVAL